MTRETIDYGIDLGTANSKVALLVGTAPEVIANKDGASFTPSAIWFDKHGKQYVGKVAKDHYFDDEQNAAVEFKLRMGEQWQKDFKGSGRKMSPEEMSAEVLKSLKEDVQTSKGEDLTAAVITVPAAFELPQCEATRRAAELAGFKLSPLLQEPVAAALAYGFQSASDKVFWLVYDFGGGTFDAALIQVRDGVIQVVNHAGDNYLGGKNIDWDIVERLWIPKLTRERKLTGFNRENPNWRSAIAKLKIKAEAAKIQVSRTRRAIEDTIDDLCKDDRGEAVDFTYQLTPQDVQRIIEPWVARSINLCKKALQEKGMSGQDIEKVLIVGGSSLFPWLQERVSSELGAKLDLSVDPMTVVARGAAVFAGTQRLAVDAAPVAAGTYQIQLEYEPVGSETNPTVGGKVTAPAGASLDGLTVQITETRSQWRSGAIRMSASGAFITEVHAEKGRKCEYQIILTDGRGSRLACSPDRFAYTVGMVIANPPLTHSISVAMADNRPDEFFKKGEPLPARGTHTHLCAYNLRRNEPAGLENVIKIPIVEGENRLKADRNRLIGYVEIKPNDPRVKRDVPRGSEVEITLDVDASRTVKTKVFIPILDEEFEGVFAPTTTSRTPTQLTAELDQELARLKEVKQKAGQIDDSAAHAVLDRVDGEQVVETAKRQVAAAQRDPDARAEGDKKLLDLRNAIDEVEAALEWPALIREARSDLSWARGVVEKYGTAEEKKELHAVADAVENAITNQIADVLRAKLESLKDLGIAVVTRQPEFWVDQLEWLKERRSLMRDITASEKLFAQAARSVNNNDLEALKAAVRQLHALLPRDEQVSANTRGLFGGTTIRLGAR